MALLALVATTSGCASSPSEPQTAWLLVKVQQNESLPSPGKRVEVLTTGEVRSTDANGAALFSLLPGRYIVRVSGLNRGGPGVWIDEFAVDLQKRDFKTVTVFDCVLCV